MAKKKPKMGAAPKFGAKKPMQPPMRGKGPPSTVKRKGGY